MHPLRMSVKAACGWRSTRIRTFLAKEALTWASTLLTSMVPASVAVLIAGRLSLLALAAMSASRQERFSPQFKGALLAAAFPIAKTRQVGKATTILSAVPMLPTHSNREIPMAGVGPNGSRIIFIICHASVPRRGLERARTTVFRVLKNNIKYEKPMPCLHFRAECGTISSPLMVVPPVGRGGDLLALGCRASESHLGRPRMPRAGPARGLLGA